MAQLNNHLHSAYNLLRISLEVTSGVCACVIYKFLPYECWASSKFSVCVWSHAPTHSRGQPICRIAERLSKMQGGFSTNPSSGFSRATEWTAGSSSLLSGRGWTHWTFSGRILNECCSHEERHHQLTDSKDGLCVASMPGIPFNFTQTLSSLEAFNISIGKAEF